jgi:hypothetical protein
MLSLLPPPHREGENEREKEREREWGEREVPGRYVACSESLQEDGVYPSSLRRRNAAAKRALSREYATFFDPMIESWYSPDVSFEDPLTSLTGVGSYARRKMLGRAMFDGACIDLHSVTGGGYYPKRRGE